MNFNTIQEILSCIMEIQVLDNQEEYIQCYLLSKKYFERYPASSELCFYVLHYAQLVDEDISDLCTLDEIREGMLYLSKMQNGYNLSYIVNTLGILHNVFDEKNPIVRTLFINGNELLIFLMKQFYSLYFDYLTELKNIEEINKLISEINFIVTHIPTSLLDDCDYYGKSN